MNGRCARPALVGLLLIALSVFALPALAASVQLPGIELRTTGPQAQPTEVATAFRILLGLTVLSLAPAILIVMTAFTRIIIVLAMLRHAVGMQDTPPNTVLVSLALFLTLFTMLPVFDRVHDIAFAPYMQGKLGFDVALERGIDPLREFMLRQTREQDLALMLDLAKAAPPQKPEEVRLLHLVPAFMLSELKTAFQIGFVIFLPFLMIDIAVSAVLMSMGMLMVPPMMISLPLKVLMFVLIDGWNLVVRSLIASFH